MTHVVGVVPMRHNSERVQGKNYRDLGGRPLYHHIIDTLLQVSEIDEVVIDTDSPFILEDAAREFPNVTLLLRPDHLRSGETPMNDVLLHIAGQVKADVILQTHSTNPFLSAQTLSAALAIFSETESGLDSVFGVTRLQARLWSAEGAAINHDPAVLLRTQDLKPVFLENSCFYIFEPTTLSTHGNRIGPNSRMMEVPPLEAIDIDEEEDFTLAMALVKIVEGK